MSRPTYHHGDLRSQLVAAVRELIETHGPDGFSIAQASRAAGVSSAAPYKHFKDKPEIVRAVVSEAMDRLRSAMISGSAHHPDGSLESISAIGLAYVIFAKTEPEVFRLIFGNTRGHDQTDGLLLKGQQTFGVLVTAVAKNLHLPEQSDVVRESAYILWSFVHGHAFLTIDDKRRDMPDRPEDWDYLMRVGRSILVPLHDEPKRRRP